ncbi:unnamed protein product [Lactuca saligna]|uniref:Auxin-responsive protein n=1 Tax=Lactuca saligna TaxID=75948 RepID=A0AA36EI22_LACSI|nr:unnamed protein product [Lactuca saligna]
MMLVQERSTRKTSLCFSLLISTPLQEQQHRVLLLIIVLLLRRRRPPPSAREDLRITIMDENLGTKLNGIRQIVRLKEIIQRWQHVTLGARGNDNDDDADNNPPMSIGNHPGGGINPAITMRLKGYSVYSDSDIEDGCQSPDPPNDVPRGYLAVYVGPELRRFIIPTSYLSDPLFKVLLQKVEEEFGFDHSGGLTIPCEIETFKYLLNCMEHHQKDHLEHNQASI